jgi:hypothetical protein
MHLRSLAIAFCLSFCGLLSALDVGEPVPALTGTTWIVGQAPTSAPPAAAQPPVTDQTAIPAATVPGPTTATKPLLITFWASWSEPSLQSIAAVAAWPEAKDGQIQVVALSFENEATVRAATARQTAWNHVAVGCASPDVARAFLANVPNLPHAFLIDAAGVLIWHGHPVAAHDVLTQVLARRFDLEKAKTVAALHSDLAALLKQKNQRGQDQTDAVLDLATRIRLLEPFDGQALDLSITIARNRDDVALLRSILTSIDRDDCPANLANNLSWSRVIDEKLSMRQLDLALTLVDRALAKEPGSGAYLDTKARILHELGQFDEAIALQEKAVAADPRGGLEQTLGYYRQLKELRAKRNK